MHSTIHWISHEKIANNTLGIMARPRGGDWLNDEIAGLERQEVNCLVSLLDYAEAYELNLLGEESLCLASGINFIQFPIADVSIPRDEKAFIQLVNDLLHRIHREERVVIHCRMGIGRSSMLAAAIMIIMGCDSSTVFDLITRCRGLPVPDTQLQEAWVLALELTAI